MRKARIDRIVRALEGEVSKYEEPAVEQVARDRDPWKILVSTIISTRTKDAVTIGASKRLLGRAMKAAQLAALPIRTIEKLIYPAGFYRTKARNLKKMAVLLSTQHDGHVPHTLEHLVELPGVGRKVANLVLGLGFGKPAICVDTHVHRISNRLGIVNTKTPEQTEFALSKKLPTRYWTQWNDLLVVWGQNICVPVSPHCSTCVISRLCPRNGVKRSR